MQSLESNLSPPSSSFPLLFFAILKPDFFRTEHTKPFRLFPLHCTLSKQRTADMSTLKRQRVDDGVEGATAVAVATSVAATSTSTDTQSLSSDTTLVASSSKTPDSTPAVDAATTAAAATTTATASTLATTTDSQSDCQSFDIPLPVSIEGSTPLVDGAAPVTAQQNTSLQYAIINNSANPSPMSLIRLIALKNLFSRQLPKMPRAYITRLILSPEHLSLALLPKVPTPATNSGGDVIGGICFRVFREFKFAEIAFCAVSSSQQVKGYGTTLMSCLKQYAADTGIEYFVTYADNYAIGYFKKQGFTRAISMPKSRYNGLIKDYDGGTLMECYVNDCFDYNTPGAIHRQVHLQKEFVLSRIADRKQSHVVHEPPLNLAQTLPPSSEPMVKRADKNGAGGANSNNVHRYLNVPGVQQGGWTYQSLLPPSDSLKNV
jgi:hypothetical protein